MTGNTENYSHENKLSPEKYSKYFDTQEIEALKKDDEPIEKIIGVVNIWVYVLMIVPCLFLISWFIFH